MASVRIDTGRVRASGEGFAQIARNLAHARGHLATALRLAPDLVARAGASGRLSAAVNRLAHAQNRAERMRRLTDVAAYNYERAEQSLLSHELTRPAGGHRPSPWQIGTVISGIFGAIVGGVTGSKEWQRIVDGDAFERVVSALKWGQKGLSSALSRRTLEGLAKNARVRDFLELGPRGGVGKWSDGLQLWTSKLRWVTKPAGAAGLGFVITGLFEAHDSIKRGDSAARTASNVVVEGAVGAGAGAAGAWAGAAAGTAVCPVVGTVVGAVVGAGVGYFGSKLVNLGGDHSVKHAVGDFTEKVAAPALGKAVGVVADVGRNVVNGVGNTVGAVGGFLSGTAHAFGL